MDVELPTEVCITDGDLSNVQTYITPISTVPCHYFYIKISNEIINDIISQSFETVTNIQYL